MIKTIVFWLDRYDFELSVLIPAVTRIEAARELSWCQSNWEVTSCVNWGNLLKISKSLLPHIKNIKSTFSNIIFQRLKYIIHVKFWCSFWKVLNSLYMYDGNQSNGNSSSHRSCHCSLNYSHSSSNSNTFLLHLRLCQIILFESQSIPWDRVLWEETCENDPWEPEMPAMTLYWSL